VTSGRGEQSGVRPASWFKRRWSFNLPVGAFPAVLERLAGTPPRAAALVAGVSEARLAQRPLGKWSAKEHLGHLSDLHTLDVRRVEEFLGGAAVLTAADTSNRRTEDARHGETPIARLLDALALQRRHLFLMLENLSEKEITASAVHPRLQIRLRLIDWAQFVAEHDDHHLASARIALRSVDRLHTR
jgi:hypothetical protein